MRRSGEDLLVQVSASRHPIENLLVQFTILSFAIMAILGIVLSMILTTRLNRNFAILKEQTAASQTDTPGPSRGLSIAELDTDLDLLRWTTYVSIGGGFVILYTGLIWIVARGWRTIKDQQNELLDFNADLRAAYEEVQEAQERLVRSERLAAIGELSAGVAHDLKNPLGAIKNAVYYTRNKLRGSDLLAQDPRIGEFLEIIDDEIESSDQILNDLMDFARVNPPNRSPIRL